MEGEGVQRSFLFKMHAVEVCTVRSWGMEPSEYIGRKSIMLTVVAQGKTFFSGYRGLLGRQQLMQDCGVRGAGLRTQARQEEMAIRFAQLISGEGVRRQMLHSASNRELGPVLKTLKILFWA